MSGEKEKRSRLGPTPKPFDPADLDKFASGALTVPAPGSQEPAATPEPPPSPEKNAEGKGEGKPPAPAPAAAYPWEESQVREDVKKQILLRVPEPLYLMLQYLSKKSQSEYTSMNQIILDGTEKLVKAELKKLGIQL